MTITILLPLLKMLMGYTKLMRDYFGEYKILCKSMHNTKLILKKSRNQ